jgi:S-DNA-T family DNA segregation ATPase FtsK/SpoIIIE
LKLGWFRKVMDYLLGYEVKEIVEKNGKMVSERKAAPESRGKNGQSSVKVQPPPVHPEKERGEMQARVSYQYPQGKFRFPLISDDELAEGHRERRKERDERRQDEETPSRLRRSQQPGDEEPYIQRVPGRRQEAPQPVYWQENEGEEQQSERTVQLLSQEERKEPVKTKPFRPTEVPSPIYGFKQRPVASRDDETQNSIEFELPSASLSLRNDFRRSDQALFITQETAASKETADKYEELMSPLRPKPSMSAPWEQEQREAGILENPRDEYIQKKPSFESVQSIHLPSSNEGEREEDLLLLKEDLRGLEKVEREEENQAQRLMGLMMEEANAAEIKERAEDVQREQPLPEMEESREAEFPYPLREEDHSIQVHEENKMERQPLLKTEGPKEEEFSKIEQPFRSQGDSGELQSLQAEQAVEKVEPERVLQLHSHSASEQELVSERAPEHPALADERYEEEKAEQVKQQPAPLQTEQVSRRSRPAVPFNVMMLKKDRERLTAKASARQTEVNSVHRADSGGDATHQTEETKMGVFTQKEQGQDEEKERLSPKPSVPSSPLLTERTEGVYEFPSMKLLNVPKQEKEDDHQWLEEQRQLLDTTLKNFNVRAKVVNVTQGPTVTRFEVHPEPGVKVNKITNLTDDIKLSLAAKDIRIEAPIPGKNTIGIEVPNRESKAVLLWEILSQPAFYEHSSPLSVALGLDISGTPIVTDLKKMPHGLIAGATGSGKSVCINTIIVSLLYKASPHQVKLMLIDPKMVELAPYNGIPHLVSPVITDAKAATAALKWAVEEMERRYELFAHTGVRDITKYNEKAAQHQEKSGELPYLVIIIDELADLMMVSPGEVEEAICRIAQKARACGIHLLLATQRPSVDVITGLIKANVPTRVAFSVSSQIDSRTIIDTAGAEKLLGRGDMLLLENGSSKTVRVQGNFVSDEEIDAVVDHVKKEMKPNYLFEQNDLIQKHQQFSSEEDELFHEACEFVLSQGGASTSSVQRHFRIGYNRAARLIDMMEGQGIISEAKGTKPRDVLITEEELIELQNVGSFR